MTTRETNTRRARLMAALAGLLVLPLAFVPRSVRASTDSSLPAGRGVTLALAAAEVTEPGLSAECSRLRAALDRANAEISTLKRADRGVRDDYRLRQKMADAEDLARRLTAAEADLRQAHAGRHPLGARTGAAAPATPSTEGPVVLQARADLLSDQARRLTDQAAGFARAAGQLRTRQTLRRRAGQVERDPFASMDGSKRIMLVQGASGTATKGASDEGGTRGATNNGTQTTSTPGMGTPPSMPTVATSPMAPGGSPTSNPGFAGPGNGAAGTAQPSVPTPLGQSTSAAAQTILDPTTMAELRKMEVTAGHPMTEAERLERAAAALTGRAQVLEAQAKALRDQAAKR